MKTIWKVCKENTKYAVSSDGEVRNIATGRILQPFISGKAKRAHYPRVGLSFARRNKLDRRVHKLVANAFLRKCRKDETVNHKNHNRFDNRVSNLEIIPLILNINKSVYAGVSKRKLSCRKVRSIRKLLHKGVAQRTLGARFGVSKMTIFRIAHNKLWRLA